MGNNTQSNGKPPGSPLGPGTAAAAGTTTLEAKGEVHAAGGEKKTEQQLNGVLSAVDMIMELSGSGGKRTGPPQGESEKEQPEVLTFLEPGGAAAVTEMAAAATGLAAMEGNDVKAEATGSHSAEIATEIASAHAQASEAFADPGCLSREGDLLLVAAEARAAAVKAVAEEKQRARELQTEEEERQNDLDAVRRERAR